ncbi:MAG: 1-(5-phosphoribosyl)-5-[(5-phosphoribosylamino)methylideneamino]imidazole-4-carboxamide isomerase [Abditibacteriota bacterium]|nr:1-(5-phosphoribosyl)-5-[(5-phosphoribosylamino)methylideneamino]imidazole-4-carboxamide isomerase [Abditibacteriota bacterium]
MEIIPAIDIIDGQCVRLVKGDFARKTVYSEDPAETAKRWAEHAGAIHLVDLEGSRQGRPLELSTLSAIRNSVDCLLEYGGGVRCEDHIKAILDSGADRVILGTSAASDEEFARDMLYSYGDKIVIGIDTKDGMVAIHGWEKTTALTGIGFAQKMEKDGARRIIYTDISRDGMMAGANVPAMKKMAESVSIPVIASGGISSIEDIKALSALGLLEGAIIGKALYTGAIDIKEAVKWK